jgi:release factor glutamine methyltransferase
MKQLFEQTTYQEVLNWASSFLEENGKEPEAAKWLLRERLDWSTTDLVRFGRSDMPNSEKEQFKKDIKKYLKGYPVQHIVGHEWFYHRKFKVTSDTLVPRPETEEWLHRVLTTLPDELYTVVDIGTGSGILGITYKLERKNDRVIATDISKAALKIAEQNAKLHEADIAFRLGDLTEPIKNEKVDIVLCNPPYIGVEEKNVMDESVIEHEPESALFAENNGLALYQRLAKELPMIMKDKGQIFLEIGYLQGEAVTQLFQQAFPHALVEVWKDYASLDRVVHIHL